MNAGVFRRFWLAGVLGALAAQARDIPVHREYTKPITFYDESGQVARFADVAPDLAAQQSLRDAQAQELLLGREPVLAVAFSEAGLISRRPDHIPGKLSPQTDPQERRVSQRKQAERNWLAGSLSLKNLGQSNSNVATEVFSRDSDSSGWGWLANDVARAGSQQDADSTAKLTEEIMRAEESATAANPSAAMLTGAANPFWREDPALAKVAGPDATGSDAARGTTLQPGNLPTPDVAARPDLMPKTDAVRTAPSALAGDSRGYAPAAAAPDLGQTRQLLDSFKTESRPDFTALRESLTRGTPPAAPAQAMAPTEPISIKWGGAADRPAPDRGGWSWGQTGTPGASGGLEKPKWGGDWGRPTTGANSWLQHTEQPAVQPVTYPGMTKPKPSSGGLKPGWY